LEGTIKAEGEWAEAAGREAFWKYEIAVGFNPLLGVEWKLPLFTPLPVPKWILTCGIYLTLFGEINVNVKLVRTTPRFKTGEGQSAAEGKLGGRLSAEISAGNGELFKASASGETSISLTSKGFTDEKGYGLDGCEFSWDGVTGAFEATALHGIFKFKRGVQLIKPRLIGSKSKKYYLPFGKKDARPAANPAAPVGTPKPVGTHLPPPSSGGRKPLPPLPPKKKTGPAPKAPPRPARPLPPIPKPRTSGGSRSGGESGSSSSSTGSRDGS
jgi:hypothetical protein